jgi:Ca-activated chloride channel homolog
LRITNPQNIFFFIFLIPVAIGLAYYYLRGSSDLNKLAGSWRFSIIKGIYRARYTLSSLLYILSLTFLAIGLLGLSWQMKPEKDDSFGLEIIITIDVSNSMRVRDLQPDRLQKSISYISSLVDNLLGVKFGVIAFKGEAITIIPVTEDTTSINRILPYISPDIISSPGSNQEKGIKLALESFSRGTQTKKIILLISDGEALEGDILNILNKSIEMEIPIYTLAAGTSQGGGIPVANNEYLVENGKLVTSRVNKQILMYISELSYGKFYSLVDGASVGEIIRDIKDLSYDKVGEKIKYVNVIEYRLFLLVALLLLLLYVFFKEWRWSEIL